MSDMLYQKNPTGPVTPSGGTQSAKLPANRGISADASAEVFNLTASDRVALGFGGIADFISAGSIYTQGMFESTKLELAARTLDFNKRALNRDIQDISYVTGIQASNIMKASAEMKGRQKAAQAESGFSVNET